jgi:hypothetical protein
VQAPHSSGAESANVSARDGLSMPTISNDPQGAEIDWSTWFPSQTEDLDFNSLRSLSGQMRAQAPIYHVPLPQTISQTRGPTSNPSLHAVPADDHALSHRSISPAGRTRREAAAGMAMITLEAAAEPHYVGESSGSFWSDVVAKGMCEPRSKTRNGTRLKKAFRHRSPSPTDRHILRTSLQRQMSNDVADHILLTVYRHLHARVSSG